MKKICICGGGALGHVAAGYIAARSKAEVRVLTNHPERWSRSISVHTPEGESLIGSLSMISSSAEDVVTGADVLLFCLPGFLIKEELEKVRPYLGTDAYVGTVFSSTGFFFEALKILSPEQPLWGFQRVPFISRVVDYGHSANLLGYKSGFNIAVEHVSDEEKSQFADWVADAFGRPVHLLRNYLEASLTNSNPILHTSRLYTLFSDWNEGVLYPSQFAFYDTWDVASAQRLIRMDKEFFDLLDVLPVTKGYLPTILDYYESHDAESLAVKLSSINAFHGLLAPMKAVDGGWIPDFSSRYFSEDFPFGLRYIHELGVEHGVDMPEISKVLSWGLSKTR